LKWHHQSLIKKIPAPDTEQIISMRSSGLELLESRPPSKADSKSSTTPYEEETAVSEDEILRRWVKIERTASSSITRGKKSIVGNTVPVIEAREIMALEDEEDKAEEMEKLIKAWMSKYDSRSRAQAKRAMEGDTNTDDQGAGEDGYETDEDEVEQVERWVCPGCRGVI
jgi:rubrerythrin